MANHENRELEERQRIEAEQCEGQRIEAERRRLLEKKRAELLEQLMGGQGEADRIGGFLDMLESSAERPPPWRLCSFGRAIGGGASSSAYRQRRSSSVWSRRSCPIEKRGRMWRCLPAASSNPRRPFDALEASEQLLHPSAGFVVTVKFCSARFWPFSGGVRKSGAQSERQFSAVKNGAL